jgi:hypothetical protein
MDQRATRWRDLTREQQKILVRLYGGGSTRRVDPDSLSGLRRLALVEGNKLSGLGRNICTARFLELQTIRLPHTWAGSATRAGGSSYWA